MVRRCLSGVRLFVGGQLLGHQIDDDPFRPRPEPSLPGFGVLLVTIITEVFRHRGVTFPQSKGEPLIEVIVRGNPVGNSLRIT